MPRLDEDDITSKMLAANAVGHGADELGTDMLGPDARQPGTDLKVVAKRIVAALTPLFATVWGIDRLRDRILAALLKRLAAVAPEIIDPPSAYIAGPILLQLSFCADQAHLLDLYANLLAASMDRRRSAHVHPAYVHVIEQLTPDEAVLLLHIATVTRSFSMSEQSTFQGYRPGQSSISEQFRVVCRQSGANDVSRSDEYLDNLIRLRIFTESHWTGGEYVPPGSSRRGIYEEFVENTIGRLIELSAFGEKFLAICVRPPDERSRSSGV
jgi:hypothetical protein